jgi:hypothetical protein
MKPGYKTSEFWAALLSTVFSGVVTAHQAGPVTIGTVGWNVLPAIAYILSRGYAKGNAPAK